jgi:hypothetical protein
LLFSRKGQTPAIVCNVIRYKLSGRTKLYFG